MKIYFLLALIFAFKVGFCQNPAQQPLSPQQTETIKQTIEALRQYQQQQAQQATTQPPQNTQRPQSQATQPQSSHPAINSNSNQQDKQQQDIPYSQQVLTAQNMQMLIETIRALKSYEQQIDQQLQQRQSSNQKPYSQNSSVQYSKALSTSLVQSQGQSSLGIEMAEKLAADAALKVTEKLSEYQNDPNVSVSVSISTNYGTATASSCDRSNRNLCINTYQYQYQDGHVQKQGQSTVSMADAKAAADNAEKRAPQQGHSTTYVSTTGNGTAIIKPVATPIPPRTTETTIRLY